MTDILWFWYWMTSILVIVVLLVLAAWLHESLLLRCEVAAQRTDNSSNAESRRCDGAPASSA